MVILAVVCCNFITSNICTYLPHCSHECNNLKSDATGSLRAASIGLSFFPYPSTCRRLPQSPGSVMLRRRRRLSRHPLLQQSPLRHPLQLLSHRRQLFLRFHNDRQLSPQRLLQALTHHLIPPTILLIRDLEPRTLPMETICMEGCQDTAVSEVTG